MPNPLFEQYGHSNQNRNNRNSFFQFAMDFLRNNPNKSPEDAVKELLSSGRMSQQQFEEFKIIANSMTGKRY